MSIVSINIVAYNEEKNIEKSLRSALNQSYSPIEIFLIDNNSQDRTVEIARQISEDAGVLGAEPPAPPYSVRGRTFSIIQNEKNLGFGGGHNVGFRESCGDFVLCLNADCELDKNYVKYAIEAFKRNNSIGAVQGKLLNRKTGKLDATGLLIFKNRRVVNRGQGEEDTGQYENLEEIWGVDGAAPVYRRAMLEDVKIPRGLPPQLRGQTPTDYEYFDEDFFAYKEDIDLSWRMRLAGWKCMYEPRAIGYHDRSAGEGTKRNLFEIIKERRKISEFAKFHSFANQRLMQIKNETPYLFFKNFLQILPKELLSWAYVLLFEKYGWKSAVKFFRLVPRMIRKRSFVMERKRIRDGELEKWLLL